jgi:hypothetical protein
MGRRKEAFWQDTTYGRDIDAIVELIETPSAAETYCDMNLGTLRKCEGVQEQINDIISCTKKDSCRRILCPICARKYRLWCADRTLRWFRKFDREQRRTRTITVDVEQVANEELKDLSIAMAHEKLRKRLRRANIFHVIGGTEVSYSERRDRWTLHFHLLVFDARNREINAFKRSFRKDNIPRAVNKSKPIKDAIKQITYLQKFWTLYRACGGYDARGKGQARRFKPAQMSAWALWVENQDFEDFLFLVGFRRYADRIVPR